jgi:hypothetical protein
VIGQEPKRQVLAANCPKIAAELKGYGIPATAKSMQCPPPHWLYQLQPETPNCHQNSARSRELPCHCQMHAAL